MSGSAVRSFAVDHPAAAGHFPGNPIIPGAFLLQVVAEAVGADQPGWTCGAIESAKFLHPVRPGDTLRIDWQTSETGAVRFTCTAAPPDAQPGARAVTGVLRFRRI